MKLLRYGSPGHERPGVLDQKGQVRDISAVVGDITGEILAPDSLDELRALPLESLPRVADPGRIGPCVTDVSKVVCIGLNYRDHAKETGKPIPEEPILFMKATSSINGPDDDVVLPKSAEKGDWEVELGVVIGRPASYVPESDWADYVAGYCVVNDVSERAFQIERGGQWVKGKSADTFCPLGPWLVTADEVADPQALRLTAEHDLQLRRADPVHQPVHDAAARRRDRHRHAGGRRVRPQPVPPPRRHHAIVRAGLGRAAPARRVL